MRDTELFYQIIKKDYVINQEKWNGKGLKYEIEDDSEFEIIEEVYFYKHAKDAMKKYETEIKKSDQDPNVYIVSVYGIIEVDFYYDSQEYEYNTPPFKWTGINGRPIRELVRELRWDEAKEIFKEVMESK